jgi:hypothetical protein
MVVTQYTQGQATMNLDDFEQENNTVWNFPILCQCGVQYPLPLPFPKYAKYRW